MVGFDAALEWEFLRGFREWLALRTGEGKNLAWPVLASRYVSSRISTAAQEPGGDGEEGARVNSLIEALQEFLELPPQ
jgi:hypothetical protein